MRTFALQSSQNCDIWPETDFVILTPSEQYFSLLQTIAICIIYLRSNSYLYKNNNSHFDISNYRVTINGHSYIEGYKLTMLFVFQ